MNINRRDFLKVAIGAGAAIGGASIFKDNIKSFLGKSNKEEYAWNFIASNDPNDYKGDRIIYESYSDWKNYKPLLDKVNELTKGINNEYDKAIKISKWVMNSRPYDREYEKNVGTPKSFRSVIDIFNEPAGVCWDSAILTTALLRAADIPARAVSPAFTTRGMHEFTEACVDGKWIDIDSTYGTGNPIVVEDPSSIVEIHKLYGTYPRIIDRFSIYERTVNQPRFNIQIVPRNGFGQIEYPVVSTGTMEKLYEKTGTYFGNVENLFLTKGLDCDYFHCKNTELHAYKAFWSPGIYEPSIGVNLEENVKKFEDNKDGIAVTTLPEGNYRIEYTFFSRESGYLSKGKNAFLAYSDFEVKRDKKTKIGESSFEILDNADKEDYEIMNGLLKKAYDN